MLMDMIDPVDPRYLLAEGIYKDADWLHSLVENILNLTRLQNGKLVLTKQMEAAEEVVGGAVSHINQRSPEHEIKVRPLNPTYFDILMANCHDSGFTPRILHEARSVASQVGLVGCNQGIALVPLALQKMAPENVQIC